MQDLIPQIFRHKVVCVPPEISIAKVLN